MKKTTLLLAFLAATFTAVTAVGAEYGVFIQAAANADGTFEEVVQKCEGALEAKGWQVVTSYGATAPAGCGFRAHTIVLHNEAYARKLLARGPMAAFVLPPRVSVFEDESGINVAFVNPLSLSRTVLGDGVADKLASQTAAELSAILAGAAGGKAVDRQLGQVRSKGRVGGMGGGDFADKVEVIYETDASSASSLDELAKAVKKGIKADQKGWELSYALNCIPQGVVILGVNKGAMEAKAFTIAGEKRARPANSCPGIDHAAALPIEVIVYREGSAVKVALLDEMYRMKVYFEDAGKWAFMKNMRMPGQIEKEIVAMTLSGLEQ